MSINILMSRPNFDQEWAKALLTKELKDCKSILVLAFSFLDDEVHDNKTWHDVYDPGKKYYEAIYEPFSSYGFEREQIKFINYFSDSQRTIKKEIDSADILFLPGGAPDLFMQRIKNKGLATCLREYDGIVFGCSAGAMIQFKEFHIAPNKKGSYYSLFEGLGIIGLDMGIEVHYNAADLQLSFAEQACYCSSLLLLDDNSGAMIKNNCVYLCGNARIHPEV